MLHRYVIEREVPGVGHLDAAGLCHLAGVSNAALAKLRSKVQWKHTYVTGNKTFCIYRATDERVLKEHARLAGIPINVITRVDAIIDPTTER